MRRYVWIFAFSAVNGLVPNLPVRTKGDYSIDRVPPKSGGGSKSLGKAAPLGLRAVELKDKDIEDFLFVSSRIFLVKADAQRFILRGGAGLPYYNRAINAVLYEIPDAPKDVQGMRPSKKRASKKAPLRRAAAT